MRPRPYEKGEQRLSCDERQALDQGGRARRQEAPGPELPHVAVRRHSPVPREVQRRKQRTPQGGARRQAPHPSRDTPHSRIQSQRVGEPGKHEERGLRREQRHRSRAEQPPPGPRSLRLIGRVEREPDEDDGDECIHGVWLRDARVAHENRRAGRERRRQHGGPGLEQPGCQLPRRPGEYHTSDERQYPQGKLAHAGEPSGEVRPPQKQDGRRLTVVQRLQQSGVAARGDVQSHHRFVDVERRQGGEFAQPQCCADAEDEPECEPQTRGHGCEDCGPDA